MARAYGEWGSRKYLLASLDQSLARMNLDCVDTSESTPVRPGQLLLEETMCALDSAVRQGKALYVGVSSYSAAKTREAAAILRDLGTPLLHPPAVLRDAEPLDRARAPRIASVELGVGCIAFSPLAQGMLTDKYLGGIPRLCTRECSSLAVALAHH